jgi:hypothetical protein
MDNIWIGVAKMGILFLIFLIFKHLIVRLEPSKSEIFDTIKTCHLPHVFHSSLSAADLHEPTRGLKNEKTTKKADDVQCEADPHHR